LLAIAVAAYVGGRLHRSPAASAAPVVSWRGERLEGPSVAFTPCISPDGKELAFAAMVEGQSQLALMNVDSGDWKLLTTNRDRGVLNNISWSQDGAQIYFDRVAGGPIGIYRISKYGGDERLVLEGAMCPRVRPDGSMVVARRDPDEPIQSNLHLYLYSPETEQLRALNAIPELGMVSAVALTRDGSCAVFHGRTTNEVSSPKSFWQIDLSSGKTQPFFTNVNLSFQFGDTYPFVLARDSNRFLYDEPLESLHRIVSVDPGAPERSTQLLTLTSPPLAIDADSAGNLYVDQTERPNEIFRQGSDGAAERIVLAPAYENEIILPLPGNRFLVSSSTRGANRLMVIEPGRGMRPFLESKLESTTPFALLGSNQVVFTLRDGSRLMLATASLEGRSVKTIQTLSWPTFTDMSIAGAPDGKTVFYAEAGSIRSVPASGGEPETICLGHSVAVDPAGSYLIVKRNAAPENYLVRYSLADRTEQRVEFSGQYRITGFPLTPNAIGPDGRILVSVAPLHSWYWPAAVIDQRTGKMELATDLQADMYSGWDAEGRLVASVMFFRSSIWRFRPETK
jgi:hypothetical protein